MRILPSDLMPVQNEEVAICRVLFTIPISQSNAYSVHVPKIIAAVKSLTPLPFKINFYLTIISMLMRA
jgi:hypothetical protein